MQNKTIEPGLYRHYQGNVYHVLFTARHTEFGYLMVVYEEKDAPERKYVRPAAMWFDLVGADEDGNHIRRFTRCNDAE